MGKTYRRNRSEWDDYEEDIGSNKNRTLENRRKNKKRKLDVRFADAYSKDNSDEDE